MSFLNRRKGQHSFFIVCFFLFSFSAQAGYERAALRYKIEQPKKISLQYDVYAGGFKALNASLLLDLDRSAYDMAVKVQTEGVVGTLFPWYGQYVTSGHAESGYLVPSLHTATSSWRNDATTTEMTYDPKGRLFRTTTQKNGRTSVNRDISQSLSEGSVDVLTATLMVLQNVRRTQQCQGSFPVFDGKRRFDLTLRDDGVEKLPQSRYSVFSGDALKCLVEVKPVAGFGSKDQKRGWMAIQNHTEARHKLPTLWLAKLEKKGPLVPVRMEIASSYGSVVAHLSATDRE